MSKTVALLLDDSRNLYQQLLVREATTAARKHDLELLPPQFADGSGWAQVDAVNALLRDARRPDAMLLMLAGGQSARASIERVPKAGVGLVLLNRLPDWLAELRRSYAQVLVTGVAPHQEQIGRIQAKQALQLSVPGSFVILVTGTASSAAALERRKGFLDEAKDRFTVQEVDGRWSEAEAEKALARGPPGVGAGAPGGLRRAGRRGLRTRAAPRAGGHGRGSRDDPCGDRDPAPPLADRRAAGSAAARSRVVPKAAGDPAILSW